MGDFVSVVSVSINLGTACNFRCKYCFEVKNGAVESNNVISTKVLTRTIELIHLLQQTNDAVRIEFWGGEPFLHFKQIHFIVNEFAEYENVEFFAYTNGSLTEQYKKELLDIYEKVGQRFLIQVSYDYHNEENNQRVQLGKTVKETDKQVIDTIKFLDTHNFNYGTKSTCTLYDLENNIYNQYVNYFNLNKELKHPVKFSCTPDTLNNGKINEKKLDGQFIKLLKFFVDNQLDITGFTWFDEPGKADCHGGENSFIVDIDGRITYCHGCLYGNDMYYTNVFEDNCLYKMEHNILVQNNKFVKNEQCQNCSSVFCYRCNSINSKGTEEHWDDSNNEMVCKLYKKISNYIMAYRKLVHK